MITAFRTYAANEAEPPSGPAEPSQPRTLPTNGNGMGRDEFLKLLVAQMKNQDPLNPMDGKDMVAQLAQFSSVEQLIALNKSAEDQKAAQANMTAMLEEMYASQNERSDELAALIEGQMAVSTVGKIGVTNGNSVFVDRDGNGHVVVDTGTLKGVGRISILNEKGEVIVRKEIMDVKEGQQSFELSQFEWDPPLPAGQYQYKFEVATDGASWQQAKTFTTGRITGLRYQNGTPILIIGDKLSIPMSQLTQIRG